MWHQTESRDADNKCGMNITAAIARLFDKTCLWKSQQGETTFNNLCKWITVCFVHKRNTQRTQFGSLVTVELVKILSEPNDGKERFNLQSLYFPCPSFARLLAVPFSASSLVRISCTILRITGCPLEVRAVKSLWRCRRRRTACSFWSWRSAACCRNSCCCRCRCSDS